MVTDLAVRLWLRLAKCSHYSTFCRQKESELFFSYNADTKPAGKQQEQEGNGGYTSCKDSSVEGKRPVYERGQAEAQHAGNLCSRNTQDNGNSHYDQQGDPSSLAAEFQLYGN